MQDSKKILAVGSIAFDSIKTPNGDRDTILGGSCTYFSIAASHFTKLSIIGIVGDDFTKKEWDIFNKYNINYDSVEISSGDTFSWGGKYNHDYSSRETLFTNLGVFENFKPRIKGKGSAIFLHIAKKNYLPTKGCIAIKKKDFLKILPLIKYNTKISIT